VRILGLDVGEKRIGVAVSDELGFAAHAVETIERRSRPADLARIEDRVREFGAGKIVVGLPLNMDGSLGPQAESVMEFIRAAKNRISDVEMVTWDERLTTRAAERILTDADLSRGKRRKKVDQVASVLILQGYLDSLPRDAASHAL
jgi:putative Holliday junction resolvase